jgi:hypothetical protein
MIKKVYFVKVNNDLQQRFCLTILACIEYTGYMMMKKEGKKYEFDTTKETVC